MELSDRLTDAVFFLERSGFAKNHISIARELGVSPATLTMAMKGSRVPTWDMLLKFCDVYPINFQWLRSGEGDMIGGREREVALLKRIVELERRIEE